MKNFTTYRGLTIKPKLDFGEHGYWIAGKMVREGFVVIDSVGCNIMPGATWFQTVEEAKNGIDDLITAQNTAFTDPGQEFWRLNYQRRGIRADVQAGKEAVQSSRVVVRDAKEKKALAVLDALLASKALMEHAKAKQISVYRQPHEHGDQPIGSESWHDSMMRRIEHAKSDTNQVNRIKRLMYVVSDLKSMAGSANYPHGIKIKLPRG